MSYRSASRHRDTQATSRHAGRQDDRSSPPPETHSFEARDHHRQGEQRRPRADRYEEQGQEARGRTSDAPARRAAPQAGTHLRAKRRAGIAADYTLGHAGRQVRFGPVAFWTIVGTLVIMASWSLVTATYFAFHDDVVKRLVARQSEMRRAYEDRIADLRMRVDSITSRQLLDQTQFEQKLDQLLRRQATIESRAAILDDMADPIATGSIGKASHGRSAGVSAPSPRSPPISNMAIVPRPSKRAASPGTRADRALEHDPEKWMPVFGQDHARINETARGGNASKNNRAADEGAAARGGIEGALARVQDSLDRVEVRQTATLNALERKYDARARRMRGIFAGLGLDPAKMAGHRALGGPFVPVKLARNANGFDRQVYRISIARAQVDRLAGALVGVPIRKPIRGEIDETSRFGVRIDPFLGRPAMHTGIDFRGNVGDPIRATASGTVTHAGWSGGYGLMVEINHGNGLATRYGHLSMVEVAVGQKVKAGQLIGRLGSTGRSTGPHLHYETRVGGEAIDPQKFLNAGARLGHQS